MAELRTVVEGLAFPEGPRWHDGRLVFSDQHAHQVLALDPATGEVDEVVRVERQPSGLGWAPNGDLLIVSMLDQRLLRLEAGGVLTEVADLSGLAIHNCNDMVVSADGRAYVGSFGFDLDRGERPRASNLVAVDPDGTARVVAEEMQFPNGSVITPDGRTLIVGETVAGRLTAFTIAADGSLQDRRVWAQLDGALPDGICLDAEGAVWLACPLSRRCLRVREGGAVLEEIPTEQGAFACMLGDDDRRTLYICTSDMALNTETVQTRPGRIRAVRVDVPGAGLPYRRDRLRASEASGAASPSPIPRRGAASGARATIQVSRCPAPMSPPRGTTTGGISACASGYCPPAPAGGLRGNRGRCCDARRTTARPNRRPTARHLGRTG